MWSVLNPFNPVSITLSDTFNYQAPLTSIVEMYVVRQRLVLRREVGSIVLQELPFHPIFILFFLPPDRKQDDEKMRMHLKKGKLLLSGFPM